jgi:hypothetical protein
VNGRQRRYATAGTDGGFELRLPAGTWVVSVRRAGPSASEAPLELKVAVAAGATVDVGTVMPGRSASRPPAAPTPATPAGTGSTALGLP